MVDERLSRRTPSASERSRYGTWDLSSDRPGVPSWEGAQPEDPEQRTAEEQETRRLMQRQRRLSLTAAAVVVTTVFGGVVAGYVWPGWMTRPFWGGFSPLLLFAGVLVYPLTWLVAVLYTLVSNRLDGLG